MKALETFKVILVFPYKEDHTTGFVEPGNRIPMIPDIREILCKDLGESLDVIFNEQPDSATLQVSTRIGWIDTGLKYTSTTHGSESEGFIDTILNMMNR